VGIRREAGRDARPPSLRDRIRAHPRVVRPVVRLISLGLLALLAMAPPVFAHGSEVGFVHVPRDHILPGEPFPVIVSGMEPNADVTFTIGEDETSLLLGSTTLGSDGGGEATFTLPGAFPLGYSRLTATMPSGDHATAAVLVGPRAEGPGPAATWFDPGLPALGLLAVGLAVLVLGVARLRRVVSRAPDRSP
jgi:hypothetical protein